MDVSWVYQEIHFIKPVPYAVSDSSQCSFPSPPDCPGTLPTASVVLRSHGFAISNCSSQGETEGGIVPSSGMGVHFSETPKSARKERSVWIGTVREGFGAQVEFELGPWRVEGILAGQEREWEFENGGWAAGLGCLGLGRIRLCQKGEARRWRPYLSSHPEFWYTLDWLGSCKNAWCLGYFTPHTS